MCQCVNENLKVKINTMQRIILKHILLYLRQVMHVSKVNNLSQSTNEQRPL